MAEVAQNGTLRLWGSYRDGTAALTDPSTPRVDVLDAIGTVVENDQTPTRDSLGLYYYDVEVPADGAIGEWEIRWSGVIDGSTLESSENFTVVAEGTLTAGTGLVTLNEFKIAKGEPTTPGDNDDLYNAAIAAASRLARTWTDRDFGTPLVTEDRTFRYNGSGILEIDDTAAINSVSIAGGTALNSDAYYAMPHRAPSNDDVYTWLELATYSLDGSGAMGFTRNLDTFLERVGPGRTLEVTVNADWGWPEVPADVKRAVILIAGGMTSDSVSSGGRELTSQSIAEVSKAWAQEREGGNTEAIPRAAAMILDLYKRWSI